MVADGYTRYLLGCQALLSTSVAGTNSVFIELFREFGPPKRIRTDNGVPFAHHARPTLSILRLVGSPRHHPRVHRTLQTATQQPPRTHAPNPQSRNHASTRDQSTCPTTKVPSSA